MSAQAQEPKLQLEYIFIGNRIFVLEEMINRNLNIKKIFAVRDSHLDRQLAERKFSYDTVDTKEQLLDKLLSLNFDVLISNGCPYILPTTGYKRQNVILVNIHPSHLPDLRGIDPVPGSLLLKRDSGATCHRIDDGIDTGDIVSQVKIPYTDDLDAGILYQLSFLAEKEVFNRAFDRNFIGIEEQKNSDELVYFSRSIKDQLIDFQSDDLELIIRKITAFGNKSQGVRFTAAGEEFKAFSAQKLNNPYLLKKIQGFKENQVVFCYEDVVVLRKGNQLLKLEKVIGPMSSIKQYDVLR